MADEKANANPPTGTWAAAVAAGYLGIATDPTPNLNYTVAGVVQPLPTPESSYKQIRAGQYASFFGPRSRATLPRLRRLRLWLRPRSRLTSSRSTSVCTRDGLRSLGRSFGSPASTFRRPWFRSLSYHGTLGVHAADVVPVTVFTAAPGGGTSAEVNFTVT